MTPLLKLPYCIRNLGSIDLKVSPRLERWLASRRDNRKPSYDARRHLVFLADLLNLIWRDVPKLSQNDAEELYVALEHCFLDIQTCEALPLLVPPQLKLWAIELNLGQRAALLDRMKIGRSENYPYPNDSLARKVREIGFVDGVNQRKPIKPGQKGWLKATFRDIS